jgi:hypothetical protein
VASTGNVFPTTAAAVDRAGNTAWTNPGNVVSDNTTDATVTVPSSYLVTSGYDFSSIPDNATIVGVTVRVEASESGTGNSDYIPQLHTSTTPTLVGSAKSAVTVNGTTKVVSTSGGTADMWGTSLTVAQVKNSGFGVTIWSTDSTNSNTLAIDYVTIAIEYLVPKAFGTQVAAPQFADSPELAGFAALFMATAALGFLAPGDPVGAAEYRVGTQQTAIASENRSWIKGTTPALLATPQVVVKPRIAAPQTYDDASARVWHLPPDSVAVVPPHVSVAAPEHISSGDAALWGPQPETASAVPWRLLVAAPDQVDSGAAWVARYVYPTSTDVPAHLLVARPDRIDSGFASLAKYVYPTVLDAVSTTTRVASPEQIASGDAALWGPQPATASEVPPHVEIAAPEQISSGDAQLWRYVYPAPSGTDTVGAAQYQLGTHAEQYASHNGYAIRFGKFVVPAAVGTDVRIGATFVAAPEQVSSGAAQVKGPKPDTAAVVVPTTRVSAPEQVNSGYARVWSPGTPASAQTYLWRYFEVDEESTAQAAPVVFGFTPTAPSAVLRGPLVAAPEQIDSGAARVTGQSPPTASPVQRGFVVSAPVQVDSGDAWKSRYVYELVLSPLIGRTVVASPEQINSGDVWRPRFVYEFVPGQVKQGRPVLYYHWIWRKWRM